MKLLVLGGTAFLGRAIVEAALARGVRVSLFHRGRTGPDLFPEAEHLIGDRSGDLAALEGGRWDAVIETSGNVPRHVATSARLLAPRIGHHVFISSISVYRDMGSRGHAGGAATHAPAGENLEHVDLSLYGGMKVACEEAVRAAHGDRCLQLRPGLIVGPHDRSDRYTYWPERLAEGGDVLAPAPAERTVQLIDVRDLAALCLDVAEQGVRGVLDATGLRLTRREMIERTRTGVGGEARPCWVDEEWLESRGVGPWMDLPLWIPRTDMQVDVAPARAAGLQLWPLEETARDTLAWSRTLPTGRERKAGLTRRREAELLADWDPS